MSFPKDLDFGVQSVDPRPLSDSDPTGEIQMDSNGYAVFPSYETLLRTIFQPQYNVMCYVAEDSTRKEESEDTRGSGKTYGLLTLLYDLMQLGGYQIVTNIRFAQYLGEGRWKRKNAMPDGIRYCENMLELLYIASDVRRKDPDKIVIALIDEFPTFLSQLKSTTEEGSVLQSVLHIPRKLFINIIGIGPVHGHFIRSFRVMSTWKIVKSLQGVIDLRRKGHTAKDGSPLTVENTLFISARLKHGIVNEWLEVGSCPWTDYDIENGRYPPVGQRVYETYHIAEFSMSPTFLKIYPRMISILNAGDVSTFDQKGVAKSMYEFLSQYVGPDGLKGDKETSEKNENLEEKAAEFLIKHRDNVDYIQGVPKGERDRRKIEFSDSFKARILGTSIGKFYRFREKYC